MIRFDLNMEHDEVYGKFVLTVCICSILYFCKKMRIAKKQTLLLFHCFTRGIYKIYVQILQLSEDFENKFYRICIVKLSEINVL